MNDSPGANAHPLRSEGGPLGRFQYRSALALAEAIIPGSRTIPPADEATLARAHEVVSAFHPTVARAWMAAQVALAAAAVARTGRPFDRLSAAEQERLILVWEDDPILKSPFA